MRALTVDFILKATNGKLLQGSSTTFKSIGTDTRTDLSNQVFFALKGEAFDAHGFLDKALEAKAAGVVIHFVDAVTEKLMKAHPQIPFILTKDTLKALQDLAHAWRKESKSLILGITGSNGKTTSKEFTAAVLATKKKVHYSKGSFNNHWGVPLSLLAEPEGTEVSVIEMGMNHAGELTELALIAEPDVVVCSTVGRAHVEYFGTVEKIAQAKEEIYIASPKKAQRIYNLDNPLTFEMYQRSVQEYPESRRIWSFSEKNKSADVFLQIEKLSMSSMHVQGTLAGVSGKAEIPVFGSQNLTNVMVAANMALAVGMTAEQVWKALPECKTNWGRNQLVHTKKGAEILFDGYNANPDSMRALLDNVPLLKTQGKKVGVFGQMLELGEYSEGLHRELGAMAGSKNFDCIWFYGADSAAFRAGAESAGFSKKLIVSNSYEDSLASEVAHVLDHGDIALVKGSRGMKLERFVLACDPTDFSLKKS